VVAFLLTELAAELALFAAVGYFLFAIDDLLVDAIYFTFCAWRRVPTAAEICGKRCNGWIAVFIPAWDEADVIAPMLQSTLRRFDHSDYRLFVGFYRNDPATEAAIRSVADERVIPVRLQADGPTTKAHCLNCLYSALTGYEKEIGRVAKAVVLHDAEDVVHPLELRLFDRLVESAGLVQLPVIPLSDPKSPWIAGHYSDEFAEAHGKELVVRQLVGAAIPLAGVGCAIERVALSRLAARHDGEPFSGVSMTEDYEMGLRLGAIGERTIFVRIAESAKSRTLVASRGHFPATISAAIRQKARWIGGIAFAGWDRLGWRGGPGERWMRMRDRRGPLAAVLLICGYMAAILWSQIAIAGLLGASVVMPVSPALSWLMTVNAILLGWRVLIRAGFTCVTYGWREAARSIPRAVVGNIIAVFAAYRALLIHSEGGPQRWEKTKHIFPTEIPGS
jgi:adsorption protein B